MRGPKKVVENLILGLKKINYPYVVNKDLNSCKRLWIHDDIGALYNIEKLNKDVKVLIGPNLFVNPENIPNHLHIKDAVYLQPSQNVVDVWTKREYDKSPLEVWPVGIDTEKYTPFDDAKNIVLIYLKNRRREDLIEIEKILNDKRIDYKIIIYGSYKEENYYSFLKKTRYIIWLGTYESQGIALLEALSCNIPVIVLNNHIPKNIYDINSSSAPYFDKECGIIVKNIQELEKSIDNMEQRYLELHPRDFILKNLGLEKQAEKFINLYEKHFNLKTKEGFKEKCITCKSYNSNLLKKLYNIYMPPHHSLSRLPAKIYKKTFYQLFEKIWLSIFKIYSKEKKTNTVKNGTINN